MEDYAYDLPDDVTEEIPIKEVKLPLIDDHHDFPDFELFKDAVVITDKSNSAA